MSTRPSFTLARIRLVPHDGPATRARRYRPLVCGSALLCRPPRAAVWTVSLACDRRLRPRAAGSGVALERLSRSLGLRGIACRVSAVLAGPSDLPAEAAARPWRDPPQRVPPGPCFDVYGWALMYQPPGMRGRALVDADDRFADLPTVFELPLELIDRADFLESRGFRTRPLVIPTAPDDFERGPDGRLRNRFFPEATLRPPRGLDCSP